MSIPVPMTSVEWPGEPVAAVTCLPEPLSPTMTRDRTVPSDSELLEQLSREQIGSTTVQAALTQILERHGGLVYAVARRTVSDPTLADDVFQATFLVLIQSARKILRSSSLASWLHGTARNIARRAIQQRRNQAVERVEVEMLPTPEVDPFELLQRSHERDVLDDELQRMSETDRAPLVLFYLESRSHRDIAEMLGISIPAVESRLKRARQELRVRLIRRGLTLAAVIAAVGWGTAASAAPPTALVSSTLTLAAGAGATGFWAGSSATAAQLAGKELIAMSAASKITAAVLGAAGTLTVGGALLFAALIEGPIGPGGGESSTPPVATETVAAAEDSGLQQAGSAVPAPRKDSDAKPAEVFSVSQPVADRDAALLVRRLYLDLAGRVPTADEIAEYQKDTSPNPTQTLIKRLLTAGKDDQLSENNPNETQRTISADPMKIDSGSFPDVPVQPRSGPLVASFRQLSPDEEKIYVALDQKIDLDFPEASLGDIVSYLQDSAKVPIRLDEKALEESGLPPDTMCKLMMHGCRLDDALQTLCENFPGTRLGYYVDRGVLQITAFERMESTSRLRFYDLSGEIKNLASAVSQYAERMGSPPDVISHLGDSLAIRASLSTHAEIEEFIAGTIRMAEARKQAGKPQLVIPENSPVVPVPATNAAPPATGGGGGGGFF